jgi:hypothetical protein
MIHNFIVQIHMVIMDPLEATAWAENVITSANICLPAGKAAAQRILRRCFDVGECEVAEDSWLSDDIPFALQVDPQSCVC